MTDITNIEEHLQNLSKSSNTAETLGILTQIQAEIEVIITQIAKTIR
jgi:hypothetical protein|tara:strand:+ start:318 stop:458 length:141 start_codon:yes stop_codon:yes gene_type:complete